MNEKKNCLYKEAIRNWPKEDRPREKLLKNGEHTLNNSELLAILLRTGIRGESAVDLARKMLAEFKNFRGMSHADISRWKKIKGLGLAKIAQIKAALEIGRRFREDEPSEKKIIVRSSKDIADFLMPRMRDLKKEVFKILLLDAKNRIIEVIEITEGTVNRASPAIREIFQKAMEYFAVSLVCAHNHPSGSASPSSDDREFTRELTKAGVILKINVLDHVIIGDDVYYSFADEGEI